MRVLVTGGTGYLGRAIVRATADRGHEPVVFARHATRARLPGRAIDGDVRDRAAFEAAASGVDALCHSAALVSLWRRDPSEFDKINVGGLENAIAITRTLKLPRLIYTSSFLALPPAGRTAPLEANDYQRTKVAAHRVAMSMTRAFSSMGAVDQLLQIAKSDKDPEVRRQAVRSLGNQKVEKTGATLVDMYGTETDKDNKMAIISALGNQNNDTGLVTLARKETKDLELKREIVRRLAEMSRTSKVAADYLLEVIK